MLSDGEMFSSCSAPYERRMTGIHEVNHRILFHLLGLNYFNSSVFSEKKSRTKIFNKKCTDPCRSGFMSHGKTFSENNIKLESSPAQKLAPRLVSSKSQKILEASNTSMQNV